VFHTRENDADKAFLEEVLGGTEGRRGKLWKTNGTVAEAGREQLKRLRE